MLGTFDLEEAARKAAGNWRHFNSFVWFRDRELGDSEKWSVIYTSHRDSDLLDQSNQHVITKTLEPFIVGDDPDVVAERHSHWLVGHVDGFSIRVFDGDGNITEVFRTYYDLLERMEAYPVLDESDYSDREYEATLSNVTDAAWRLKDEFKLPEGWEPDVYSWLADHEPHEIENRDDQGGYPSEESLRAAFDALGFEEADE
jgi:hypothetical protein